MRLLGSTRFHGAAALVVAVGIFAACSDSEPPSLETPGGDGGDASPPASDASQSTEAGDAGTDVIADAAPARTCTGEGWCHTPLPPEQVLRGIWTDGEGVAWAISEQGKILRYDGATWTVQHTRADGLGLLSIWGSGPTDIWVGGPKMFLHGTGASSNAITWTEIPLDPSVTGQSVVSIHGASANDIYAATGPELLHYTTAGGWVIDPITARGDAPKFTAVWGRPGHDDIWISTLSTMYKMSVLMQRSGTPDVPWNYALGVSEAQIPGTYCNTPGEPLRGTMVADGDIWLIATRQYYAIDDCYFYFHGQKGVDPPIYSFEGRVLYDSYFKHNDIWGASANDVWMAGDLGTLQHWNGSKWQAAAIALGSMPVSNNLYAIGGRDSKDLWVVGDRIALHKVTP